MCSENKELIKEISEKKNRMRFHLMPPMGWMNDPNGLCWYEGYYHVFFQYSPDAVMGGLKLWGHYRSSDLIHWEYLGIAVCPNPKPEEADLCEKSDGEVEERNIPGECTTMDEDGAFSGCAFTEDGELEIFYTGNIEPAGDYDYTYNGREANIIYIKSSDGTNFSEKKVVLGTKDYPEFCTRHVRDPKVWKEGDTYYMVLGTRIGQAGNTDFATGETKDYGAVLIYSSKDKLNWSFEKSITSPKKFGYMWECPDYFSIDGVNVLACCPQGIGKEVYRYQNGDLAGYFIGHEFLEWDYGFDFYAPQTFMDNKGRRILIGWVGLPCPEYTNKDTIAEGWQHCLTMPRVVTVKCEGSAGEQAAENSNSVENEVAGRVVLLQNPVEELEQLRTEKLTGETVENNFPVKINAKAFDAVLSFHDGREEKKISLGGTSGIDLEIRHKDGITELAFCSDAGEGRSLRRAVTGELRNIRILKDVSIVECYVNDGEYVFTTRFYPEDVNYTELNVVGKMDRFDVWKM